MADIIQILKCKKDLLVYKKMSIEDKARKEVAEIAKKIDELDRAYQIVVEATNDIVCDKCHGQGRTATFITSTGDMKYVECEECHGTGVKLKLNDQIKEENENGK